LQHHPRSFADASGKASVRKEIHLHGAEGAMNIQYTVPEAELTLFWQGVLWRCQQPNNQDFREPFLIVSGHDLKLHSKRASAAEAQADFLQHLDQCFRVEDRHLPPEDCWLDFGIEDTSEANLKTVVTLL